MGSLLSDIEHASVGVEHCLLHHFRQGWMREHRMDELLFGCFEIHRDNIALNKLGDLRAYHMSADKRAGFFVEDHLHHALILAKRYGLAIADEGKPTNANIQLILLR